MKLLAVHITTCLLAVSLLVAVAVGDEAASNEAASSESVSSDESIPASGSEEIGYEASGVSSGEIVEEEEVASGVAVSSGDGESASGDDAIDEQRKMKITSLSNYEINEIVTMRVGAIDSSDGLNIGHAKLIKEGEEQLFEEVCRITHDCDMKYSTAIIEPTPRVIDGELEVSMFVESEYGPVDGQTLLGAIRNLEPSVLHMMGMELRSVYIGIPADIDHMRARPAARTSVSQHALSADTSLFVIIAGIAGTCLVVIAISLFVLKTKGRVEPDDDKVEIKLEEGSNSQACEINSPFSDEEIQRSENSTL